MLTEKVQYTNFLDEKREKTLYFHIGVAKFLENFDIEVDLREIHSWSQEKDVRDLSVPEKQKLLATVQRIIRMAYGVRSADGDRFDQSEEAWLAFRESAAYDEFLMDLFSDTDKANTFVQKVMTTKLRSEAVAQATPEQLAALGDAPAVEDSRPAWLREGRAPSPEEFAAATDEQKLAAFQLKTQG